MNRVKLASQVLQLLYQTYIVPIIDYCDTVWSPSNSADTRCLERLHYKFTSSVPSSDYLHLSLSERRGFHTALQVFKIVNKISPPYLHNIFSFAVDITGCKDYLFLELELIMVLAYRGAAIWNRLPSALYSAKSVPIFKKLYCML